jgi:ubiquinone/menaquinone biosynthesis C-methylase UbiE
MNAYVLSHDLDGERQRLALMSELLDPAERRHMQELGLKPRWRCLEIGSGNGSIAQWLASQVGPDGHVVASDLDTSYISSVAAPNLEVRQLDILQSPLEAAHYDFVVTRAVLHHIPQWREALRRMIAALKPGGLLLVTEPDILPVLVAEPQAVREFWQGWIRWAEASGVDYFIGSKIAPALDQFGLHQITAMGETAQFNGGSPWAVYCLQTFRELRPKLAQLGQISEANFQEMEDHFQDPHYWTSAINFVAVSGRKPK